MPGGVLGFYVGLYAITTSDCLPNSMSRLHVTFETLTNTPIDSAVDVLILALDDPDNDIRDRALQALVSRGDARSAQKILEHWDSLKPKDISLIREKKQNFAKVIEEQIRLGDESSLIAIEAAGHLDLTTSLLTLITLAESSGSSNIKRRSGEVVLQLVRELGTRARQNRDHSSVRAPVLARLIDSVHCFAMHRNERLIEAFLEISAWPDGDLRLMLDKPSPSRNLICNEFRKTTEPGVIELLAGFVRRRDLPPCIGQVIQARSDETFRDALLNVIGSESNATIQKNLHAIGMPNSCLGGERVVDEVGIEQLSALITLYVTACTDTVQILQVVAAAAERGGDECMAAAALGLIHCETPTTEFWMRAAIPIADGNEAAIKTDENARLISRLIKLLEHYDGAVVRGVRHVLSPLLVENIIDRMGALRPRSRRRLGQVVMMIDTDAIARVHDALRHPILAHRINAITMAESLACVDRLSESMAHIVREDHQDARIRALEVMAEANAKSTLKLLEEMTRLPDCGVRDAAISALDKRLSADNR